MNEPLLVTAWLGSPLAGDSPRLDGLLECRLAPAAARAEAWPRHLVDRSRPAPPQGNVPIPLGRAWLGEWLVAQCSDPILPVPRADDVEHFGKQIGVENADLLAGPERRPFDVTNSWTKSFRLPLRVRRCDCVRWLCFGEAADLREALGGVHAIGKKVACGYGVVRRWEVGPAPARGRGGGADHSWFAPHERGTVLMRTLPALLEGRPWLPEDLLGFRRRFGACVPPYWHPDRFCDCVAPC
ncbi:MAG TPA: hypothetical protein VFA26_05300 [Gemmataceae bacterium]|nr:hypothetical protein [Gemmataceae bacterium]